MTTRKQKPAPYQVGYGKPPLHTQFQKGKSGNPNGRPRRAATERAKALALKEAYRAVTVRDGDRVASLPALQAVLRSQMAAAAKGNVAAQRAFLATVQEIELEYALAERQRAAEQAAKGPFNYIEAARRVSFLLRLGENQERSRKRRRRATRHRQAMGCRAMRRLDPSKADRDDANVRRTCRPHPEERAPKSGLPDFGIDKVSQSATADFDARVSKDGRESLPGVHPSRRRPSVGSSG